MYLGGFNPYVPWKLGWGGGGPGLAVLGGWRWSICFAHNSSANSTDSETVSTPVSRSGRAASPEGPVVSFIYLFSFIAFLTL